MTARIFSYWLEIRIACSASIVKETHFQVLTVNGGTVDSGNTEAFLDSSNKRSFSGNVRRESL